MKKLLIKTVFISLIVGAIIAGVISLIWGMDVADKFQYAIAFAMGFAVFTVYLLNRKKA